METHSTVGLTVGSGAPMIQDLDITMETHSTVGLTVGSGDDDKNSASASTADRSKKRRIAYEVHEKFDLTDVSVK